MILAAVITTYYTLVSPTDADEEVGGDFFVLFIFWYQFDLTYGTSLLQRDQYLLP